MPQTIRDCTRCVAVYPAGGYTSSTRDHGCRLPRSPRRQDGGSSQLVAIACTGTLHGLPHHAYGHAGSTEDGGLCPIASTITQSRHLHQATPSVLKIRAKKASIPPMETLSMPCSSMSRMSANMLYQIIGLQKVLFMLTSSTRPTLWPGT